MFCSKNDVAVHLLSSDELRKILTPESTYSLEERDVVYAALIYLAKTLTTNSINVVIDATGSLRRYRDDARAQLPILWKHILNVL